MAEQAIALIGAASALAGAALTGAFTLLQARLARVDKQIDREEQRRIMQRESRRIAYAQFMAAYHELDRSFTRVRRSVPGTSANDSIPSSLIETETALTPLVEAAAGVALEGPSQVADFAYQVVSNSYLSLQEWVMVAGNHVGDSKTLAEYPSPDRDAADKLLAGTFGTFNAAARKVLGGNDPGWG